jgi:C-terminal processing protease CtpA/Prc
LIVLLNQGSASATEGFAAKLRDNHAAEQVGAPTFGAGCGHTDGSEPTILKNSGAKLELPDCVRWRADGTNEVMGVQPDILVGLRDHDGPHQRARRIAAALPAAIDRAIGLMK